MNEQRTKASVQVGGKVQVVGRGAPFSGEIGVLKKIMGRTAYVEFGSGKINEVALETLKVPYKDRYSDKFKQRVFRGISDGSKQIVDAAKAYASNPKKSLIEMTVGSNMIKASVKTELANYGDSPSRLSKPDLEQIQTFNTSIRTAIGQLNSASDPKAVKRLIKEIWGNALQIKKIVSF